MKAALLAFPLLTLLVARVTMLVVADRISAAPRRWALARLNPDGYLAYLLTCPWCVAVHVAWITLLAWVHWPGGTTLVALAGAIAMVGAWLVEVTSGVVPPPPPHD